MKYRSILIAGMCVLGVFANPVKSMIGVGGVEILEEGVSAKSYVQDGLVAMWDAIENVGWGIHDSGTTKWVDLIGGKILSKNNNYTFRWEDDALFWANVIYGPAIDLNTQAGCTAEWVGRSISKVWGGGGGNYKLLLYVQKYQSTYVNATVFGWRIQNVRVQPDNVNNIWRAVDESGDRSVVRAVYDGEMVAVSLNDNIGEMCLEAQIPAVYENVNPGLGGSVIRETNCIRIYSRPLSEEEILHNYEVDRLRYNLP